jgi:hypothetical protein
MLASNVELRSFAAKAGSVPRTMIGFVISWLDAIFLPPRLIRLGLVDQYRLWVLPAAAGQGAPLFTPGYPALPLRLAKSTAFPSSGILDGVRTNRPPRPAGRVT